MNPVQIIMTTCPRLSPGNPYAYFHGTIERLLLQLEDETSLTVVDDPLRSGHIESFRKALLKTLPDHDVLWLQDDLEFCKNSVKTMLGCTIPVGQGFVSFIDYGNYWSGNPGLLSVDIRSGLRSLAAVKFHAGAVQYLKNMFLGYEPTGSARPDRDDILVSDTLSALYSHYSVCVPNLVQHVGRFSSRVEQGMPFDNRDLYQSRTYPGPDFDASSLRLS